MTVNIDLRQFNKRLKATANDMFHELGFQMQSQLTDEVRTYPRKTVRQFGRGLTGQIAGSPRDVVDTGDLVDSYGVAIDNLRAEFTYDSDHALTVYMGYVTKLGLNVPPYPWIKRAIKNIDFERLFVEFWNDN